MTTTMTTTSSTTTERRLSPARLRRRYRARFRIVAWCVVLLALAVATLLVLLRQLLLDRVDEQVADALRQEVAEVRALATGRDPDTGQPFGQDVASIFDTFLDRNVPADDEALFTFVGGNPYKASFGAPYPLDRDPGLATLWGHLTEPDSGVVTSPEGEVRYLAVPLRQDDTALGVVVVAHFVDDDRREVGSVVRLAAVAAAGVLAATSALAWIVAGRVLAPLRDLTDTARSITETDLAQRIPVRGDDEIAELTRTFNSMLGRLEAAFGTQRAFVDDAAHELRTPITIIRGHLELLGDDPEERREVVAIVTDELDRMSRLVDDMLLLARSERPGFLDREPVHLGALAADWLARARILGERDWRLDAAAAGTVVADRQRLTQAVMNLAGNAVRHTAPGAEIGIGTALVDGTATIWVRDTGDGISPADQERVFERFARGTGAGRHDGSGLGLAIVRAIAEAHGGRISLSSTEGVGTRMTISIPHETEVRT
ncbi:MAG: sensor histidine kinase [Acidimicrobiia bacterium]